MLKILASLQTLRSNTSGVTAIEYGLIAGLIAVVIIGVVTTLGTDVASAFQKIADKL